MSAGRLTHIDSLRGIAALAVVYYHTAEYSYKMGYVSSAAENLLFSLVIDWLDLGKVAVVLFFAISGFVIPFSLLKPQTNPLRNFAISRFFRLYPAYWVSLPLAIYFVFILRQWPFTSVEVLANITMLQRFLGVADLNGVYWTLQIELIFYVISAAMFHVGLLQKPTSAIWASLLFLMAAALSGATRFVLETHVSLDLPLALCVMFWGLAWRHRISGTMDADLSRAVAWTTVAILVVIPPVCFLGYSGEENWQRYMNTYCIALLLFMVLTTVKRMEGSILGYLGLVSYSIYLMGPIAQQIGQNAVGEANLSNVPTHLVILLTLLITIAISVVVYHCVEKPAIDIGRSLVKRSAAKTA